MVCVVDCTVHIIRPREAFISELDIDDIIGVTTPLLARKTTDI